jgi:RNA polymerase subunit RPABC4/transcription elongation factor Spt4
MSEKMCEFCGAPLTDEEKDVCAACLQKERERWPTYARIATQPHAAEEAEVMIALFTLKNPEEHDAAVITWARGVLARYGVQ